METSWYQKYKDIGSITYAPLFDIKGDTEKKNYWYVFYDIIGLIGMSILFITYAFQIYHIIRYKRFHGFHTSMFYIRIISFMMIFFYAYFRKDFTVETITIAVVITFIYYSAYIYFLSK